MREMKDSGVEWIGEIPADWLMVRVKHAFIRKNEKAMQEEPIVLSLARSGVRVRDISNNEGQVAESYFNYNPVEEGDLLLNPMDLYSGANCSISHINGVISPAYINLKSKEGFNPVFYDYYFKVQYWLMAFFSYGKGVSFDNRWTLSVETLMNYPLVMPSYEEQCKRAYYLESECEKIDTIVVKQQGIIEKLKVYKMSFINESVNNDIGTKCHLGYIGKMKNGLNFSNTSDGEKIKFLGVGNFCDYFVLDEMNMFSDIITADAISEDYMLKDGDIIFVRSNGSKELVGRAVMVKNITYPLTYSGFCIRFRNMRMDIIDSNYLLYFFRSLDFRKQLEKYSQGSNINNVNQELLSQIEFTFPDIELQRKIVCILEDKCKKIDTVICRKRKLIDKLTDYKKSLIYEVVTGKKTCVYEEIGDMRENK